MGKGTGAVASDDPSATEGQWPLVNAVNQPPIKGPSASLLPALSRGHR